MSKKAGWLGAGRDACGVLGRRVGSRLAAGSAQAAVVYCKTVGVPKGCVVRPTPVVGAAVVATPASASPVSASARPASAFVPARR